MISLKMRRKREKKITCINREGNYHRYRGSNSIQYMDYLYVILNADAICI